MRRHYRSYFWPVVLIVIGIFALLVELNVISADRLYRLADLWPLILIVIGLELIARRTLQGAAVDIAAVLILVIAGVGAIAYVSAGPAIPGGTHTLTASDQAGSLTAASLDIEVGAADLTVVGDTAMGPDLYRAVLTYSGPEPAVTLDKEIGELRISQQGEFGIFGSRHLAIELHIQPGGDLELQPEQRSHQRHFPADQREGLVHRVEHRRRSARHHGGAAERHRADQRQRRRADSACAPADRYRSFGPGLRRSRQPDGGRSPHWRDRKRQVAIGRLCRRQRRLLDRGQRWRVYGHRSTRTSRPPDDLGAPQLTGVARSLFSRAANRAA